jgi:hypothetical protein
MIEIKSTSEGIENGSKTMKGLQKSGTEGGNQEIADSIVEYKKDHKGKEREQERSRNKSVPSESDFQFANLIVNRGI